MMNRNAPKDIIAEHVRLLLDLDESGQHAQLASLSAYADTKNVLKGYIPNGVPPGSNIDRVWPGVASSASVSTYGGSNGGSGREPSYSADSPESSGSEGHAKGQAANGNGAPGLTIQKDEPAFAPDPNLSAQGKASASQQLEHATDLLKAALANWEACLHNEEVRASVQQIQKAQQALKAMEPAQSMPAKIPMQSLKSAAPAPVASSPSAPSAASAKSGPSALIALQKALSECTGSLPAEAAHAAQQFLQQEAQRRQQDRLAMAAAQQDDENLQAVKMLRQHLEKQQEESMFKIMKMMQTDQQQPVHHKASLDAMANCFVPATAHGCGGTWPPMPMGVHQSPALAGALAGRPVFPHLPAGPLPAAFGMPPMGMVPRMPWAAQVGMPGAPGLANGHLRRPFNPPGRQQGQHQRNGTGVKMPPGLIGNTSRKSRGGNAGPPAGTEEETLRTHLRELQKVSPDKVVLVRKINRLGFESPAALEAHYSQYGKVERVLVAHSHVKSQNRRFAARLRPSGLGFVVMSKKEEADAILALGAEQVVGGGVDHQGATIRVQRFQRRSDDDQEVDYDEQEEQEDGDAEEVLAC
mmetsp:Transcript_62235/g.111198  ORF Transcript_62235/g.111198 Transcript_62235/m.111198 type:complete len:583 (+) Transcript_62235:64-1812(+)